MTHLRLVPVLVLSLLTLPLNASSHWKSIGPILNPNPEPTTLELTYNVASSGPARAAAVTVTRVLPARSFFSGTAEEVFGSDLPEGYATGRVTSGGGVVAFETVELKDRQTILGLNASIGESPGRLYSAQLASQGDLFDDVAVIEVAVTHPQGAIRTGQIRLAPGERASLLVPEIVSSSAGQSGGYIRINSNHLVIGQMLFGALKDGQITLLSAVPPRVIPE